VLHFLDFHPASLPRQAGLTPLSGAGQTTLRMTMKMFAPCALLRGVAKG